MGPRNLHTKRGKHGAGCWLRGEPLLDTSRVAISDTAPISKINACRRYGSEIDLVKMNDETFRNADLLAHGCCFIHTLEEYGLMDGHGTIGLEILEDAPDIDAIFVPLGAGFLACGVSLAVKALKPRVKVVGVNAENCPHFYDSLRNGEPTPAAYKPTLADGIAAPFTPTREAFDLVRETLDEVVIVSEAEIAKAVRLLALENKLVAEGAGTISLAAALAVPRNERGGSVCIISGGSIMQRS